MSPSLAALLSSALFSAGVKVEMGTARFASGIKILCGNRRPSIGGVIDGDGGPRAKIGHGPQSATRQLNLSTLHSVKIDWRATGFRQNGHPFSIEDSRRHSFPPHHGLIYHLRRPCRGINGHNYGEQDAGDCGSPRIPSSISNSRTSNYGSCEAAPPSVTRWAVRQRSLSGVRSIPLPKQL